MGDTTSTTLSPDIVAQIGWKRWFGFGWNCVLLFYLQEDCYFFVCDWYCVQLQTTGWGEMLNRFPLLTRGWRIGKKVLNKWFKIFTPKSSRRNLVTWCGTGVLTYDPIWTPLRTARYLKDLWLFSSVTLDLFIFHPRTFRELTKSNFSSTARVISSLCPKNSLRKESINHMPSVDY